jgi:hypothetical protein
MTSPPRPRLGGLFFDRGFLLAHLLGEDVRSRRLKPGCGTAPVGTGAPVLFSGEIW